MEKSNSTAIKVNAVGFETGDLPRILSWRIVPLAWARDNLYRTLSYPANTPSILRGEPFLITVWGVREEGRVSTRFPESTYRLSFSSDESPEINNELAKHAEIRNLFDRKNNHTSPIDRMLFLVHTTYDQSELLKGKGDIKVNLTLRIEGYARVSLGKTPVIFTEAGIRSPPPAHLEDTQFDHLRKAFIAKVPSVAMDTDYVRIPGQLTTQLVTREGGVSRYGEVINHGQLVPWDARHPASPPPLDVGRRRLMTAPVAPQQQQQQEINVAIPVIPASWPALPSTDKLSTFKGLIVPKRQGPMQRYPLRVVHTSDNGDVVVQRFDGSLVFVPRAICETPAEIGGWCIWVSERREEQSVAMLRSQYQKAAKDAIAKVVDTANVKIRKLADHARSLHRQLATAKAELERLRAANPSVGVVDAMEIDSEPENPTVDFAELQPFDAQSLVEPVTASVVEPVTALEVSLYDNSSFGRSAKDKAAAARNDAVAAEVAYGSIKSDRPLTSEEKDAIATSYKVLGRGKTRAKKFVEQLSKNGRWIDIQLIHEATHPSNTSSVPMSSAGDPRRRRAYLFADAVRSSKISNRNDISLLHEITGSSLKRQVEGPTESPRPTKRVRTSKK